MEQFRFSQYFQSNHLIYEQNKTVACQRQRLVQTQLPQNNSTVNICDSSNTKRVCFTLLWNMLKYLIQNVQFKSNKIDMTFWWCCSYSLAHVRLKFIWWHSKITCLPCHHSVPSESYIDASELKNNTHVFGFFAFLFTR